MDNLKYMDVPISIKQNEKSQDGVLIIEGYANRTKLDDGTIVVDRDGDHILNFGIDNYKKNPVILYQHNTDRPIGKVTDIEVTDKGLYVKGELYKDIDEQAFNSVKAGVVKTFSIGFRGIKGSYDPDNDIYYFLDTELMEISLVSVPANQESTFDIVDTPCGNGFCLASKNYKKSHSDNSNEQMTKDDLFKMFEELKQELLDSTNVTNKEDDNKQEVENVEENVSEDSPQEEKDTLTVLQELIGQLDINESNLEAVVNINSTLNDTINNRIEELLNQ
jgi:HK97 family phage prohead protease